MQSKLTTEITTDVHLFGSIMQQNVIENKFNLICLSKDYLNKCSH